MRFAKCESQTRDTIHSPKHLELPRRFRLGHPLPTRIATRYRSLATTDTPRCRHQHHLSRRTLPWRIPFAKPPTRRGESKRIFESAHRRRIGPRGMQTLWTRASKVATTTYPSPRLRPHDRMHRYLSRPHPLDQQPQRLRKHRVHHHRNHPKPITTPAPFAKRPHFPPPL